MPPTAVNWGENGVDGGGNLDILHNVEAFVLEP